MNGKDLKTDEVVAKIKKLCRREEIHFVGIAIASGGFPHLVNVTDNLNNTGFLSGALHVLNMKSLYETGDKDKFIEYLMGWAESQTLIDDEDELRKLAEEMYSTIMDEWGKEDET